MHLRARDLFMSKVSINILTKNRAQALKKALESLLSQTFHNYELVIVNDGSTDNTEDILNNFKFSASAKATADRQIANFQIIHHPSSIGITASRQEALAASNGEYVAILDDDDVWSDKHKLNKQVEFLNSHRDVVLVGGGITISNFPPPPRQGRTGKLEISKSRPQSDIQIRQTMLFRNNFFTSSVMFRREAAIKAGGFVKDGADLAEDYDLWLRMGQLGKMYNFQEAFVNYRVPSYNKEKFKEFLQKQLRLIQREKGNYPGFLPASLILKIRLLF